MATHAVMTGREFARVKGELSFWCSACAQAHHRPVTRLWREGEAPPADAPDSVQARAGGRAEDYRRHEPAGASGAVGVMSKLFQA